MEQVQLLFNHEDELISEITFYKLTEEGYEVLTYSGSDGLKEITTINPNVMLLEINLPDIIGYEISKVIKTNNKKVQVIMIKNENNLLLTK